MLEQFNDRCCNGQSLIKPTSEIIPKVLQPKFWGGLEQNPRWLRGGRPRARPRSWDRSSVDRSTTLKTTGRPRTKCRRNTEICLSSNPCCGETWLLKKAFQFWISKLRLEYIKHHFIRAITLETFEVYKNLSYKHAPVAHQTLVSVYSIYWIQYDRLFILASLN